MGAGQSGQKDSVMGAFYGGYQALGGIVGGGDRVDLKDYDKSLMSAAKKQMIRDLAYVLGKHLGIKELQGEHDVDTLIKLMRKHVPDPRPKGNKLIWSKDKQSQIDACNVLAKAINDRMGNIINPKAGPEEKCFQTAEVVHALFGGISVEFAVNREQIERSLSNLRTL